MMGECITYDHSIEAEQIFPQRGLSEVWQGMSVPKQKTTTTTMMAMTENRSATNKRIVYFRALSEVCQGLVPYLPMSSTVDSCELPLLLLLLLLLMVVVVVVVMSGVVMVVVVVVIVMVEVVAMVMMVMLLLAMVVVTLVVVLLMVLVLVMVVIVTGEGTGL